MKIAEDIATVFAYLHTAFPRPFVHREMRPGSIILDEDGVARLSDFSSCISIPQGETFVRVDRVVGTLDFVDGKYFSTVGEVSENTDVFAIGILMLKLVIGEEIFQAKTRKEDDDSDGDGSDYYSDGYKTSYMFEYETTFSKWRKEYYQKQRRMVEVADPEMLEKKDEVGEEELRQMEVFLMLSQRCIGWTNLEYPNMVEVVKELKNIQRSSFPSASGESEMLFGKERSLSRSSSSRYSGSYSFSSDHDLPR